MAVKDLGRSESRKLAYAFPPVNWSASFTLATVLKPSLSPDYQVIQSCLLSCHSMAIIKDFNLAVGSPRLTERDLDPYIAGISVPMR